MKSRYDSLVFGFALLLGLALTVSGCAGSMKNKTDYAQYEGIAKGFAIEIGEIKAGSFETAPYIPRQIRFYVDRELQAAGLTGGENGQDGRLIVTIETSASYVGGSYRYTMGENYSDLTSHVQAVDAANQQVVARTSIVSHSFSGGIVGDVSDFTESTHAKEIVEFLAAIVR
jgi:hypothetical protein